MRLKFPVCLSPPRPALLLFWRLIVTNVAYEARLLYLLHAETTKLASTALAGRKDGRGDKEEGKKMTVKEK